MRDRSNYLDPDRADAVRFSGSGVRALGEVALVRVVYCPMKPSAR
jgi:hypothetical protein